MRVRTVSAPGRPSRLSSMTWRGKVPSQALDMPRMWIWRGSAASRGLKGRRSQPRKPQTKEAPRGPESPSKTVWGYRSAEELWTSGPSADAPATRHKVCVTMGEDDHVTGSELHLLLADEPGVAAALGEDVVRDEVLRRGQDTGREFARSQGFDAPGLNGLDGVEVGAVEAYDAQQIGERIHSKA